MSLKLSAHSQQANQYFSRVSYNWYCRGGVGDGVGVVGVGVVAGSVTVGGPGLVTCSPGAVCFIALPRRFRERAVELAGMKEHCDPPDTGLKVRRSPDLRALKDTVFGVVAATWLPG